MIFYGNIQIPRNFDACADNVYQAPFPRKKESLGSRLPFFVLTLTVVWQELFKGLADLRYGFYHT